MNDLKTAKLQELTVELQQLEQTFADELSKGANHATLSILWQRIKDIRSELDNREERV